MKDTEPADRAELVERLVAELAADERVRAAWLTGSLARGDADPFSDVDVWAVVAEADHPAVVADWPKRAERVASLVHQQQLGGGAEAVFHQVTSGWLRFDVALGTVEAVPGRARNLVRKLFDRDGLSERLGPPAGPLRPQAATVERLTREFLRVLGLLPVALGRADHLVAASGSGLARTLLIELMREDVAVPDRGGALNLVRLLPAERRDQLAGLPPIEASAESAVAVHTACARLFLPLARDLAARTGAGWPAELERATGTHLRRQLGLELE